MRIYRGFDEELDEDAHGEAKGTTDDVKQENQDTTEGKMKRKNTHPEAGTGGTKCEHLGDVKIEDKPIAPTSQSCTSSFPISFLNKFFFQLEFG